MGVGPFAFPSFLPLQNRPLARLRFAARRVTDRWIRVRSCHKRSMKQTRPCDLDHGMVLGRHLERARKTLRLSV